MKNIDEIIEDTVNRTVLKLKLAGLMKDDRKTAAQKTEELLRNYPAFKLSDQPYTKKLCEKIESALWFTVSNQGLPARSAPSPMLADSLLGSRDLSKLPAPGERTIPKAI